MVDYNGYSLRLALNVHKIHCIFDVVELMLLELSVGRPPKIVWRFYKFYSCSLLLGSPMYLENLLFRCCAFLHPGSTLLSSEINLMMTLSETAEPCPNRSRFGPRLNW